MPNTLIGHCLARALLSLANEDVESGRRKATDRASTWDQLRIGAKAAPRAQRVTEFLIFWAIVLQELDDDATITIEDFAHEGFYSRATAYRRRDEFRQLFPEEVDPNRIARALVAHAKARATRPSPDVPLTLTAA